MAPETSMESTTRGWIWIPASLLALGLGAVAMLAGSNWIRESLIAGRIELVRSVGEVQTRTAIAHLWVEELVSGDDVDRESLAQDIAEAERLMDVMLETGGPRAGWLIGAPEGQIEARTQVARSKLHQFAAISRERQRGFDVGEYVQVGSPIDVRYDAVFLDLLSELRTIERLLKDQLHVAETRSGQLFQGMLGVWVALVSVAVFGSWHQERRRRRAEAALHDSEAQLLQAQKMEAVGRLAGGIAHDINNHLAAIMAQCELVKLDVDDVSPAESMDSILTTANKSSALIRRLLAFSRQQPVSRSVLDLNGAVEGLQGMLSDLLSEEIEVRIELSPELWAVEMDPSQLDQVILNLAVNARDAMARGGKLAIGTCNASVEPGALHAQRAPAPGSWVMLTVTDEGSGIAPEIVGRIFEPFFTTKDSASGSGLGLATLHGIVRQANGHVTVESEVGRGSTFRVFLPRSAHRVEPAAADEPRGEPQVAGSTASILLVEDNDDLRDSTRRLLESMGYLVTTASDPALALEIHRGRPGLFDLMISDVIMPGMDGKQLADRLLQTDPDLRVIFVSGYTDDVILGRGIDEEEVNFLAKPFSAAELRTMVLRVLNRSSARQAS